jgi:hypothetical protein
MDEPIACMTKFIHGYLMFWDHELLESNMTRPHPITSCNLIQVLWLYNYCIVHQNFKTFYAWKQSHFEEIYHAPNACLQ